MKLLVFGASEALCLSNCIIGCILELINTTYNINIPFTMLAIFYLFQLFMLTLPKAREWLSMKVNTIVILIGALDAITNFCNNFAFAYTDVGSVILLQSLVAPFSMISSFLILKRKFSFEEICCSIITCLYAGLFTYLDESNVYESNNKLLGDFLAIISAVGIAIIATLNEIYSNDVHTIAYTSRMAIGGFITCLIGLICIDISEYKNISLVPWLLMIPYGILMEIFYGMAIFLIENTSAVSYNMVSLCANFYSFIATVFVMKTSFKFTEIFPAIGILIGVILYFLE